MKKLLVLGASANEITLVKRAQSYGIYVIVTDYNTEHKISPAKDVADEYWDISWNDIDILEKKCREECIDGIIAGYSELRITALIKLCKILNLPCYINERQLELTSNKIKFKNLCRLSEVPTVKEYTNALINELEFPVILKPADRGGSIGVVVAYNKDEFKKAYKYAMSKSITKNVIIEKYIDNATKIDVYYSVINGQIQLLTSSDTIMAPENKNFRVVQNAWVYPSKYHSAYINKVDQQMRTLIKNLEIKNGYIFISGFVDDKLNFVFFETGFRLCGGHIYAYLDMLSETDNLDLFIFHALGEKIPNILIENKNSKKCVSVNFYAKAGKITQILGREKVENLKSCIFSNINAYIGEECDDSAAILNKIGMFSFSANKIDEICEDIKLMNSYFTVVGENQEDMIYSRFDPCILKNWWNN